LIQLIRLIQLIQLLPASEQQQSIMRTGTGRGNPAAPSGPHRTPLSLQKGPMSAGGGLIYSLSYPRETRTFLFTCSTGDLMLLL